MEESGLASLINPRHLNQFNGNAPELIWPSLMHPTQPFEYDSSHIPSLQFIQARHENYRIANDSDQLLGCKVFWEVFRRSKLVVMFDRHMTTKLLRRLREELRTGRARSLETILLFAGKDELAKSQVLAKDIQKALAESRSTVKFRFVNGMKSTSAPFPHDRFAITDGEFWHFGGTAGGFEQCLTAVSRGWRAKNVGAIEFIHSAWEAMMQEESRE